MADPYRVGYGDLPFRSKSLHGNPGVARLQLGNAPLDAETIRNLKARYAALCDNQYDADGIASLFTEDAVWESPALGRFEGREAIRNFFRGASGIFSFAIHYSLNGHIEVDGDTARLFMPCTVAAGNRPMWRASIDHETYARAAGIWMFRHKRSEPLMSVPFETGWATARFA